jgi:hypothetical protein
MNPRDRLERDRAARHRVREEVHGRARAYRDLVVDVSASGNFGSVSQSKRELAAEVAA